MLIVNTCQRKTVRFKISVCSDSPCGHESWVMIEGILSQVQVGDGGVTLCDKVHRNS